MGTLEGSQTLRGGLREQLACPRDSFLRRPGAGAYARAVGSVLRVAACRVVGFAALIALGGCSQAPAPPAAKLLTLFDVQALYAGGALGSEALAANDGLAGWNSARPHL